MACGGQLAGRGATVNVGLYGDATEVIEDLLPQCELGDRLANRGVSND
jgi:hypothetical protein